MSTPGVQESLGRRFDTFGVFTRYERGCRARIQQNHAWESIQRINEPAIHNNNEAVALVHRPTSGSDIGNILHRPFTLKLSSNPSQCRPHHCICRCRRLCNQKYPETRQFVFDNLNCKPSSSKPYRIILLHVVESDRHSWNLIGPTLPRVDCSLEELFGYNSVNVRVSGMEDVFMESDFIMALNPYYPFMQWIVNTLERTDRKIDYDFDFYKEQ
ncbi:MAG: hypothetical protein J3R72DRAFT_493911 [Linnemannia gamsii]|nr:MAG: hypothetical protein J3R72DRAFT_493911 [Linnemannia gamsii]